MECLTKLNGLNAMIKFPIEMVRQKSSKSLFNRASVSTCLKKHRVRIFSTGAEENLQPINTLKR